MNKKLLLTITVVVAIVFGVYGMKLYTDSYGKKNNIVVQENKKDVVNKSMQQSKGKTQEGISKDKEQTNITKGNGVENYYQYTDFILDDLQGNKVKLSNYKGKRVFLNFWTTWCGPCKKEIPDIIKIYNETKDSNLVIIAVNMGEDREKVEEFAKEHNMDFKILLDKNQKIAEQFSVSGIPTTFLINEKGGVTRWTTGAMEFYMMKEFIK